MLIKSLCITQNTFHLNLFMYVCLIGIRDISDTRTWGAISSSSYNYRTFQKTALFLGRRVNYCFYIFYGKFVGQEGNKMENLYSDYFGGRLPCLWNVQFTPVYCFILFPCECNIKSFIVFQWFCDAFLVIAANLECLKLSGH